MPFSIGFKLQSLIPYGFMSLCPDEVLDIDIILYRKSFTHARTHTHTHTHTDTHIQGHVRKRTLHAPIHH